MKKSFLALVVGSVVLAATSCSMQPSVVVDSSIPAIQGDGFYAVADGIDVKNKQYISNQYYRVQGVVTAVQHKALGNDLKQGFFIQGASDNNPNTSDGIFVQTNNVDRINVGDLVDVVAKVKEDYGWTKLVNVSEVKVLKSGVALPKPVILNVNDADFMQSLERYEGMFVRISNQSNMYVTKNYGFDYGPRRNNMLLSHNGAHMHPNQLKAPTNTPDTKEKEVLVVESFARPDKGKILWYPSFGAENNQGSTENYIRINDLVDGLEGVVGYSYGKYRLYVTNTADSKTFIHKNDRKEMPPLKNGGDLRIASFNVLNYFNSSYSQSVRNPLGQNRGAHSLKEFHLQSDKIATAIARMNADIVGLMEIENNGFDANSAVADLVKKINSKIKNPKDHYSYISPNDDTQFIGTDAISNQVIYKKNKVSLAQYRIIKMPSQHAPASRYSDARGYAERFTSGNVYQRDTVAPTFKIKGSNKVLTVAVNHFKSKGSVCWEDIKTGKKLDVDMQGSCENLRVAAAEQLGNALNKINGPKIIIGDLNSYGNEDPIMVLTNRNNAKPDYKIKTSSFTYIGDPKTGKKLYGEDAKIINKHYGYVNIIRKLHPNSYSYSYGPHIGTLDYILISPSLVNSVVDANDWNINAGESTLFEYADKYNCYKGECSKRYHDIYRASDHDPAVIDLKINKIK